MQPLWLLSVLSVLSAAALACGLAWGTGVVTVPATAVQAVAGTVCLLLLFYLFRVLRTMRWTPILLLFVSTGLLYTTGTLAAPAMLMALLCATGFSALLLAVADKATLTRLAFIPLAAYGLSLALCRDPMLSLAALMPFPAAAALAFGTRASAEREDGPRAGRRHLPDLALPGRDHARHSRPAAEPPDRLPVPRASRRASGQPAHGAESPAGDADATACRADPAAVCPDRGAGTEYHQFRHQSVSRHGSHAVQPLRRAHAGPPAGQSLRIRVRRLGQGQGAPVPHEPDVLLRLSGRGHPLDGHIACQQ
ncbi:MAG: purine permease [Oscillospiraceae bacterium]|nr:MAG: purine permease [Oscillospiraceae bacterium]